jgi:APA family basic amino acid/polyamine antiporter
MALVALADLTPKPGSPVFELLDEAGIAPEPGKRLFEILTNYCIFGGSVFYLLAVAAVFVLRRRRPNVARPYRTWGYPITPAVFIIFYGLFLAGLLQAAFLTSVAGLALLAVGWLALRVAK